MVVLAGTVAAGIEGDAWQISEPAIGSDLPKVWLRAGAPEEIDAAVKSVQGNAVFEGPSLPKARPTPEPN